MTVYYFGIPGSFTHAAALSRFSATDDLVSAQTFKALFASVKENQDSVGVIPIENTLAGSIYENYDLLEKFQASINGEIYLRVEHNLLGSDPDIATDDFKRLKKVYSHPKALEQCQQFFDSHPWVERVTAPDTANAAKLVKEQNDGTVAAIASKEASTIYNLSVLVPNLEDNHTNFTRFLVICSKNIQPTGSDKCSLTFTLPHQPGSLGRVLTVLSDQKCNLTKIESRPIVGKPFEYLFYIDFVFATSQQAEHVLDLLKSVTSTVRTLGIYRSVDIN